MQKARCHQINWLQPLVSAWFQGLFHSSVRGAFHLSLTVLVHYRSLSSIQPQRMVPLDSDRISPVPPYSGYCQNGTKFRVRDFHPLRSYFPKIFHYLILLHSAVLQPRVCRNKIGLGCSPFARHYLGNHYCFLFLGVLRCFSSPRSLPITLSQNTISSIWQVAPFGYLRIKGYLHLTEAFRSLSRPSSPLRAQASAMRPQ